MPIPQTWRAPSLPRPRSSAPCSPVRPGGKQRICVRTFVVKILGPCSQISTSAANVKKLHIVEKSNLNAVALLKGKMQCRGSKYILLRFESRNVCLQIETRFQVVIKEEKRILQVLWIRIQIGSVFSNFMELDPQEEMTTKI